MAIIQQKRAVVILLFLTGIVLILHSTSIVRKNPVSLEYGPRREVASNMSLKKNQADDNSRNKTKIILFWDKWYGSDWSSLIGDYRRISSDNCPVSNCYFTMDHNFFNVADAVLFRYERTNDALKLDRRKHKDQVWIYVNHEAPNADVEEGSQGRQPLSIFNWTLTYHSKSDVVASYGYFEKHEKTTAGGTDVVSVRSNFLDYGSRSMQSYLMMLRNGTTLEDFMGASWKNFTKRPKIAAWMSSHCKTYSMREDYIKLLQEHVPVDTFGKCGVTRCGTRQPLASWCWINVFRPNYLFYLSMENSICDEYLTEKVYMALIHGLVPVVYGGGNYSKFLLPNSYVNAMNYHPSQLAELLRALAKDPVAYGRYHLWRRFWTVHMGSKCACELCYLLDTDPLKYYSNVLNWRSQASNCSNFKSKKEFHQFFSKKKVNNTVP